jgi:DNA helicase-2/ATP-dependent DNA helicase PcrA
MANREYAASHQARGSLPTIRMYSIPAAKGLEFDHVIIPDVSAGVFDGNNQEERNLFYVAASRARKELTMTYQARPSSFLQPFEDSARWDEVHSAA